MDLAEYIGPPLDRDDFDLTTHTEALRSANIPVYPRMKPITAPLHPVASNQSTDSFASPASHMASGTPIAATTSRSGSVSTGLASALPPPNTQILGPSPWKLYEQDPNRPPVDHEQEADAETHREITTAMNKLNMRDDAWRYHGKASLAHLLSTFQELKHQSQDEDDTGAGGAGPGSSNAQSPAVDSPASATSTNSKWGRAGAEWVTFFENMNQTKRPEFWAVPEYEVVIANENVKPVDFSYWPDAGLDHALIDAYFDKVNVDMPLLNRLIFVRQYTSGLHRTNHDFAKVCLMVFANGARFTHDERIYWPRDWATTEEGKKRLEEDADGTWKYSAGWKYMRAVLKMGRSVVQGPNLFDFQNQVLICMFLQGAAVPHLTLLISGVGLRGVQELGIHVRSTLMRANPVERALYNRAFWCLYHIDRLNCAAVGRSVALQDTDFDADYPIAVDDEYWETGDPATDFVQPAHAGVSKVAAFVHLLKLDHVIGAALRTLYAINHLPGDDGQDMAQQKSIVMELDSALNSWADSVPDSLRWDPTRTDQRLFEQSAVLYSQYYYCQILIHRPFIPTPRRPVTIGLPSLVICSNASRSIANIVDAVLRRGRQYGILAGQVVGIHFLIPCWSAAVILLVSIYAGRQQKAERERAMQDVRRCIAALKEMEMTWRQAGKMTDMLCQLASEPIKRPLVEYGNKRRQPEEEVSPKATHFSGGVGRGKGKRGLAGRTSLSRLSASAAGAASSGVARSASDGGGDKVSPTIPQPRSGSDGNNAIPISAPSSRPKTPPFVWGLDGMRNGNAMLSRDDLDLPSQSNPTLPSSFVPGTGINGGAFGSDLDARAHALAQRKRTEAQDACRHITNYIDTIRNQPDTVPFHSPSTFATDLMAPSASDPTVRAVPMTPTDSQQGIHTRQGPPHRLDLPISEVRRGSAMYTSPTSMAFKGQAATGYEGLGVATASSGPSSVPSLPTPASGADQHRQPIPAASNGPIQTNNAASASQSSNKPNPDAWFDPALLPPTTHADNSWITDTFAQPISAYQIDAPIAGSGAELAIPFDMDNLWDATMFNPLNGGYDFGDVSMGHGGSWGGGMDGMNNGGMGAGVGVGVGAGLGMGMPGSGGGFGGMGGGGDGTWGGMNANGMGMSPGQAGMGFGGGGSDMWGMGAGMSGGSGTGYVPGDFAAAQQRQQSAQGQQSQPGPLGAQAAGASEEEGDGGDDVWKRFFSDRS